MQYLWKIFCRKVIVTTEKKQYAHNIFPSNEINNFYRIIHEI